MGDSIRGGGSRKPTTDAYSEKFPLYLHKTGHYAKKVRGRVHYFGKDRDAALARWMEEKDDLLAGRMVRPKEEQDSPTVAFVCNALLTRKRKDVDNGRRSIRTWEGYKMAADLMVAHLGRNRLVSDIRPLDWADFRDKIASTRGPVATGNVVRHVRGIMSFAYKFDLIEKPIKFGDSFSLPEKKELRAAREERGVRMFDAATIRTILAGASQPLKAMVLLGINCAFGQSDCSKLTFKFVDLESGWHRFPRTKNSKPRRCPLWPETIAAIREAVAARPTPSDPSLADRVFITKFGGEFVKVSQHANGKVVPIDAAGLTFGKLLRKLGLKREGLNFYALRHTFQTVAEDSGEAVATSFIMGHCDDPADMSAVYREQVSDERLRRATDHVRAWLMAAEPLPEKPDAATPAAKRAGGKSRSK